jgi:SOS response regulatory protein OraA/RecX
VLGTPTTASSSARARRTPATFLKEHLGRRPEIEKKVKEDDADQRGDDDAVSSALAAGETGASPNPPLQEAVSDAVATIRRITAAAPASEGRVRRKLEDRELPDPVVKAALQRARDERLIDDDALAAALVAEWRAKGHAPRRLRDDLRKREFDEDVVQRAVAVAEDDDPMAAAFALAKDRASKLRHVEAETAYRRVAAYLARRGHGEGIARKAARDAVYDDRHDDRTAGR